MLRKYTRSLGRILGRYRLPKEGELGRTEADIARLMPQPEDTLSEASAVR